MSYSRNMLNNLIDRMKLPFRKEKELYSSLYDIIGFYPHDIQLYKLALMHKSMFKRNEKGRPVNNERLEFLGDAILDAAVGDIVYRHFPGKREGFLTNTRSKLVQRETLNRLAQEMGINDLIMSNSHTVTHNSYMGGNAFEALVGAIYLDQGYNACMRFINKRILNQMINIDKVAYKVVNFKSKLIEWSQKNRVHVEFRILKQEKDNSGSPVFKYMVVIEGLEGSTGTGYSKKESQQMASKLTLARLRKEPQFIDQVFAAKTERTKMEEEPVENVPDPEAQADFIISHDNDSRDGQSAEPKPSEKPKKRMRRSPMYLEDTDEPADNNGPKPSADKPQKAERQTDEFDLSDLTHAEKSREEVIAAAEEAAFRENGENA